MGDGGVLQDLRSTKSRISSNYTCKGCSSLCRISPNAVVLICNSGVPRLDSLIPERAIALKLQPFTPRAYCPSNGLGRSLEQTPSSLLRERHPRKLPEASQAPCKRSAGSCLKHTTDSMSIRELTDVECRAYCGTF
jgi:hypothetical protein